MNYSFFITGFPGFLASSLIKQMIQDHRDDIQHMYLLILPSQKELAKSTLDEIINQTGVSTELFIIAEGDITKQDIGLGTAILETLSKQITHVFHLAAIYDLAVPKDIAYEVNVNGTKNVNKWLTKLRNLKRYIYYSTAYVSGKREGK